MEQSKGRAGEKKFEEAARDKVNLLSPEKYPEIGRMQHVQYMCEYRHCIYHPAEGRLKRNSLLK